MMYVDFTTGEKEYKLALSTRSIVALEKEIGCNPLMIFGANSDQIPTVSVMVAILHASLQKFEHGITENDACDIFDKWLEDGNSMTDFIKIIMEIYKVSGLVNDGEKNEKN